MLLLLFRHALAEHLVEKDLGVYLRGGSCPGGRDDDVNYFCNELVFFTAEENRFVLAHVFVGTTVNKAGKHGREENMAGNKPE